MEAWLLGGEPRHAHLAAMFIPGCHALLMCYSQAGLGPHCPALPTLLDTQPAPIKFLLA